MANIDDREAVCRIHKEYAEAGVDAIKTNTFGANRMNFPDESMRDTIIRSGFDIATAAVKDTSVRIFADIGYFDPDADQSRTDPAVGEKVQETGEEVQETGGRAKEISVQAEYQSIAEQFARAGATNFLFETFAEYEPVLPALKWIKMNNPGAFVMVSFAVSQDGYTRKGLYYKTLLKQSMDNPDIDVCGLNCICGPSHLHQLLRGLDHTKKPLCAMPNSGYPATINGRTVFQDNAGYFADKLCELYRMGIVYLGGCCGTTPEHMRQAVARIHASLEERSLQPSLQDRASLEHGGHSKEKPPVRINLFRDKLLCGRPVIAVELDPPMDTDIAFLMSAAKKAKDAGADIITIADSPLARTRADSILLAAKVKREVGIDTLPHLSCRDRNHISLKASVLGASIENINNILLVTGDPIAQTDRGVTKGVFSYNSFQLIAFVKSLNEEIMHDTPLTIAAALNVNSGRFGSELKRAQNKMEKGADLFLTQPLFSAESIQNALYAKDVLPAKILFGIMPLAGYKNAMFLNNEVAGVHIPEDFVKQLEGRTPEEIEALSLRFSMDIVTKTKHAADGFYLITPLKKIDLVCKLIRRILAI